VRPAVGETERFSGPGLVSSAITFVLALPLLPVVLLLRRTGVLRWTIEARARPWGRRGGPPVVLRYAVANARLDAAFDELITALARGDGAPELRDAERI
jgi:hypothetical protein